MIIKCPECETSFLVPDESLAPKGRKVRCSNCQTEWFQKYQSDADDAETATDTGDDTPTGEEKSDQEEPAIDDDFSIDDINPEGEDRPEQNLDDIPESVKPEAELDDLDISRKKQTFGKHTWRVVNYLVALGTTLLVLLIFSVSGGIMTSLWPASVVYYDTVGLDKALPGEDLRFDNVKAGVSLAPDGSRTITVTGNVLNTSESARTIPPIKLTTMKADTDEPGEQWKYTFPDSQRKIEPKGRAAFETTYTGEISPKNTRIDLKFVQPE